MDSSADKNDIIPYPHHLSRRDRSRIKGHQPAVLWLTGLSGSGKSSLANRIESILHHNYSTHTYLLDGDNIRKGINADLGFSAEDRQENIRRIAEISKLFYDAGLIVLTAFISPYSADRAFARNLIPDLAFIEIYVDCPITVCQQRDPKGLYQKALHGEIPNFTGITDPYEAPLHPEIHVKTHQNTLEECANQVITYLHIKKLLQPESLHEPS